MNRKNTSKNNLNQEGSIARRCRQSCRNWMAGIEQAKNKIADEFRGIIDSNQKAFQLAVNEAEALAWQTEYPGLMFPALAVEKLQAVGTWQTRQQAVRRHQLIFAGAA